MPFRFALLVGLGVLTALSLPAQVTWVKYKGGTGLPKDVVVAGVEEGRNKGLRWVVCRVPYNGVMTAGKGGEKTCNFAVAAENRGRRREEFEVAVETGKGSWGTPRARFAGALQAGTVDGKPLIVCRARFDSEGTGIGVHAGQVSGDSCIAEFSQKVVSSKTFEVYYPGK